MSDKLQIQPDGLPVLRLVNATIHNGFLEYLRQRSRAGDQASELLMLGYKASDAELRGRLAGKQLRIYPE